MDIKISIEEHLCLREVDLMHRNGLIVSAVCEAISITGFLYSYNALLDANLYLWNGFALDFAFVSKMQTLSIIFGICVIVFLILIIYFYRKD